MGVHEHPLSLCLSFSGSSPSSRSPEEAPTAQEARTH